MPASAQRQVFVAGGLSDENTVVFTATLAASGQPAVTLLDNKASTPHTKTFLESFKPERVVPVGSFPNGIPDLEERLGIKTAPALEWKRGPPVALWKELFPRADQVVVCPVQPRRQLLQAACLAGTLKAPLFVTRGEADETDTLNSWLATWRTREVFAVGEAAKVVESRGEARAVQITELADEASVATACLRQLKNRPVNTVVVANPADDREGLGRMSLLAPWVAVGHRAALLLTNDDGDNTADVVQAALKKPELKRTETIILTANLKAIPMLRRPNPLAGKDEFIETEPMTPEGTQPISFAVGRLFHQDLNVVAMMLARAQHPPKKEGPRKAFIASNPGGSLPLLEMFSLNTTREFKNAGYETASLFRDDVTKEEVRRLLPEQDIFLWEGHHKTLVKDFQLPQWTEPLPSSFVFLQSCLALNEEEAHPLLERGAVAIAGSSTRTYSGSGGAFSLAFFDAMLYEDQTLGGSLRQAKNYLLCYSLLKEKRLGEAAKLNGANVRSAWAFTLWGDPTLKLPKPQPPQGALPRVQHRVQGNTLIVTIPQRAYDKLVTEKYQTEFWPNARLAGLLTSVPGEDERRLVPFLFTEVYLPQVPADKTPRLNTKIPSSHWVFCWDARRNCGYLIVSPRAKDEAELRFQVRWDE